MSDTPAGSAGYPAGQAAVPTALIIDDQKGLAELLAERLSMDGFQTTIATTATDGLAACAQQSFDVAFVDLRLPDMSGLAAARQMRKLSEELKIILVTGFATSVDDQDLSNSDLNGVLPKPWRPAELEAILRTIGRGRP